MEPDPTGVVMRVFGDAGNGDLEEVAPPFLDPHDEDILMEARENMDIPAQLGAGERGTAPPEASSVPAPRRSSTPNGLAM